MRKIIPGFLVFILSIILIVFLGEWVFENTYQFPKQDYGVTFSPRYARYLKLDWQKTYLNILDELKVRNLRLPSYWDILEKEDGKYDFTETDFMLSEALKRGAKVILVVGARQPRWPECQYPLWARKLTVLQRQQKTLDLIQKVVEKYQANSSIWAYQVENEPFAYWFGENCDPPNEDFLQKEVSLIKQMDKNRSVIVTDSGEWGNWVDPMKFSDIIGISVYKKAYNNTLRAYISYPFTPLMYDLKSNLIRKLFAPNNQKTIIAELQTEPWLSDADAKEGSSAKENQLFSAVDFKANIDFVKKTGFYEAYLWGVEWWYFMDKSGHPEYLQFAKDLFK